MPFQRRWYNCWPVVPTTNNNDATDLCSSGGPSGYPNSHDTPKSHLKLNQVNFPSSAIEANKKGPLNSILNLTAKRSTTEVRFPKGWCSPHCRFRSFYHLRLDKVQKSYTAFNNQVRRKTILSNANWTRKENPKYLITLNRANLHHNKSHFLTNNW